MKTKCDFNEGDGLFWMSFKDFKKHFVSIHLCKFVDKYKFNNIKKVEKDSDYHIFGIQIEHEGN